MHTLKLGIFLSVLLSVSCVSVEETSECPKQAFTSEKGDIPLLITNEHGADHSHALWFIPEREGVGVKRFVRLADQYTDLISEQIADEFYALTAKKPYLLVAELPRSQIDFNRPPSLSYESRRMAACHQQFHDEATNLVKEIKQRWQEGYLLDVHGQSKFPDQLIRGTRNGTTVKHLIEKEGKVYAGENGLFGLMEIKGYSILPKHNGYEEVYIGGYMLKQYGSHQPNGIDAVQLEIGRNYRNTAEKRDQIAKDVALSLVKRMTVLGYLKKPLPKPN